MPHSVFSVEAYRFGNVLADPLSRREGTKVQAAKKRARFKDYSEIDQAPEERSR